ncbi:hypothetical protein OPV22_015043 [Ensete ventricosum]|uniref:Uncharacterized protein n=1 Tax=Ensete ventricosum TaxID=4639 RepID=A0AAV8R9F0_ENSVE|nr:hypothetical protein OPV22_015043 [Ensete ventricosum]
MQGQALTTRRVRQNPFELLVALDEAESASGEVFVDDGEEVEMGGAVSLEAWVGHKEGGDSGITPETDIASESDGTRQ